MKTFGAVNAADPPTVNGTGGDDCGLFLFASKTRRMTTIKKTATNRNIRNAAGISRVELAAVFLDFSVFRIISVSVFFWNVNKKNWTMI